MKFVVDEMPTKTAECPFVAAEYAHINPHCKLGGRCFLSTHKSAPEKCPRLISIKEVIENEQNVN